MQKVLIKIVDVLKKHNQILSEYNIFHDSIIDDLNDLLSSNDSETDTVEQMIFSRNRVRYNIQHSTQNHFNHYFF